MAKVGGARPGAGRKPGIPNKITQARREELLASGVSPLDYMLGVLRNDQESPERRFAAAKEAAPYLHARLASVQHTGDPENPVHVEQTNKVRAEDLDPETRGLAKRLFTKLVKGGE